MMPGILNTVGGMVSGAANTADQSIKKTTTDQVETPTIAPESAPQTVEALQNLPTAQQASEQATRNVAESQAKALGGSQGLGAQQQQTAKQQKAQGTQQGILSNQDYQKNVQETHQLAIDTENTANEIAQHAAIDPNRYMKSMGVGQATMSAIGLVLSGIGSGLAGQQNMAMGVLQKNIDRDIAAQQQTYQNAISVLAEKRGLLQTAQQRQTIAIAAKEAASMQVYKGVEIQTTGVQNQLQGDTAKQQASVINNISQQKYLQSLNGFNALYVGKVGHGVSENDSLVGIILRGIQDNMKGSMGLGSLTPTTQNYGSQEPLFKIPSQSTPAAPAATPIPVGPSKVSGSFLDALSRSQMPKKGP